MAKNEQNRGAFVTLEPNRLYSQEEIRNLISRDNAVTTILEKENIGENQLKRGADEASLDNEDEDSFDDSDEELPITENCDQIRRKIRTFIDNGGMKVKEFVDALGVSSVSYYRFMNQYGKEKGESSETYFRGSDFFKKREAKGIPMPKKRKVSVSKSAKPTDAKGIKATQAATVKHSTSVSIAGIELDGELEDAVEVYDSCDEIRRKLNAHLSKPGVTQAAFLRELQAQLHGPRKPKSLQSSQLAKFRSYKGPVTGNTSAIYYAAYVYFEKNRLAAGGPKSKHRLDMEDAWIVDGGVDVSHNLNNVSYIVHASSRPYMDSLGRVCGF